MARPQSKDYEDRKQKILDASSQLFAKNGYHKASVSSIAIECDMSKALLYHYYPSKQEILYNVMLEHVEELDVLAKATMETDLPAEAALKKIIEQYLNIYKTRVNQHHLLINELDSLTAIQKNKIIEIQNNVVDVFADLAEAICPTSLERHHAKTAISMLMLGMINWTYIWYKPEGSISSSQLANIITCLFIDGIKGLKDSSFEV